MEIIAELEGVGRGPYTGAMGYLSRCGRLDTNILIRTLVCEGDTVSFRAGAGIVADSRPRGRTGRNPCQGARPAAGAGRGRMSDALAILWNGEPVSSDPGTEPRPALRRRRVPHAAACSDGTVIAAEAQLAKLLADAAALGHHSATA